MNTTAQIPSSNYDASIVIPVLNEAEGISMCHQQVTEIMDGSGYSYELIYVDDGSSDRTSEIIKEIKNGKGNITCIRLKKNYGQQKALLVGLNTATGKVIITYDSDLQFLPDCLPGLCKKVIDGADIVSGIRQGRNDSLFINRIPSIIGGLLINKALNINIKDFGSVKSFSHKLVKRILQEPTDYSIVYATAFMLSDNYVESPVVYQPRKIGKSKWSILRRIELYLDIYVTYTKRPFEWIMLTGWTSLTFSIILGACIIFYRLFINSNFAGTIIFFDVFLFFFGLQFAALSFIGEFVLRIFRRKDNADINEMILE